MELVVAVVEDASKLTGIIVADVGKMIASVVVCLAYYDESIRLSDAKRAMREHTRSGIVGQENITVVTVMFLCI
jgi:hypothetical protein